MGLLLRDDHGGSLSTNPPIGDHHITEAGTDWLWTVTAIYAIILIAVVLLTYFAPKGEKIFHYLFTISLFAGAVGYFSMASDLADLAITTADNSSGTRQVFYARYITWFFSWPSLLIAVGVLSGVSWATIIYNIALCWVWVVAWLAGAVVQTNYKWGYFVVGVVAYFILAASLVIFGTKTAKRVGITKHYLLLVGWMLFLWTIYPIAWGLDDGGNEIKVTSGFIFFGILDTLLVPVLVFAVLVLERSWDFRALNLYFTQYGRVAQGGEFPEREKAPGVQQPAAATPEQETV